MRNRGITKGNSIKERVEKQLGVGENVASLPAAFHSGGEEVQSLEFLLYSNSPDDESITVITNGLNSFIAQSSQCFPSGMELLFCCKEEQFGAEVIQLWEQVCNWVTEHGETVDYGQLVVLPLVDNAIEPVSFVLFMPVYHADEFEDDDELSARTLWAIPITNSERVYIEKNGWNEFEEIIEQEEPDFTDLSRHSMIEERT